MVFGPKLAIFPIFFLGNIGQENVLYDIVRRKTCILGYKKKKFKQSKNWHFSKGFWSKYGHFPTFFLGNIGHENVTAFKAIKTRGPQGRKIAIFLKELTHGFGPKMAIFASFFF